MSHSPWLHPVLALNNLAAVRCWPLQSGWQAAAVC